MKALFIFTIFAVATLPVASIAYGGEWDDFFSDTKPKNLIGLGAKSKEQNNHNSRQRLNEVSRLDQEILILRAEMSQKNGDARQVKQYLEVLDQQSILPMFKARIASLKKYIKTVPSPSLFSLFSFSKEIEFAMNDRHTVVAIVLPSTGKYGVVGTTLQNAIQEGLTQAGFKGKLIALDSSIYDSAFEMWEVLKYYDPSFIFGPLQKNMINQWQNLETGVATLYFNDTNLNTGYEFSLSPNKTAGLEQVFQVLNHTGYDKIMVLSNQSGVSKSLEQSFHQAWLSANEGQNYVSAVIDKNVGKAIDKGLNVEASNIRYRWLQSVLSRPLVFEPRLRKDIEAVVSLVPQSQAIQVSPYLKFLSQKRINIANIWYPSKTPSASYLVANNDAWRQTFAILPFDISQKNSQKSPQSVSEVKNGLFYALGRVAVEIVKNPSLSSSVDSLVETEFGTYVRNSNGQFHLLPTVYWVEQGTFEKFFIQ